jgi:hypothetical protein
MTIELNAEIDRIASKDLKERHSYFQLQHFLIGKEPTTQSKLWRCVKELKARKETIDAIKLEIEDTNDDIELINIKLEEQFDKTATPLEIKKREINFKKLERSKYGLELQLANLHNKLNNTTEECSFLVAAFNSLERIEQLKPQDDFEAQKEYWDEKLSQEYNLRMLLGLPPDMEMIKTILALNSDSQVKKDVISLISSIQNKMEEKHKQQELDKILSLTKEKNKIDQSGLKDREQDAI